jgi:hypothetical protein
MTDPLIRSLFAEDEQDNHDTKDPGERETTPEEDLAELKDVIKKLEELQKQQKQSGGKPPRRPFIAIEFGGVFHHNPIINFLFGFVVNLFFAYTVIEVFQFAKYTDLLYLVLLVLLYSVVEEVFRTYVMMRHFSLVMRSFGTIFYFGYLVIFYLLDQYVFVSSFRFINATLLVFFVLIFTILRYFFGTSLRRYFRRKNMR